MIGVALFEAYIFPFEMVSILLLAAIVGALLLSARAVPSAQLSRQPITDNRQPNPEVSS